MGNRRKKRYQSKGNIYPPLVITGRCFLRHHEESYLDELQPGDMQFFLASDTSRRDSDDPYYDMIGGSGYLKAEIYDGKNWQFLVMDDFFAGKEHHFGKKERPLDTYFICEEVVRELAGTPTYRTYRSHYMRGEPDQNEETED